MHTTLVRLQELIQKGQSREAAALASRWCETQPNDAQAWFLLGAARHRLGLLPEALEAFERVLSIDPAHRDAPVARATLLSELGRHAQALRDFDHLLAQSPGDPTLLTNAGIVLERLGRMSDAIARYDAVLAANPHWTDALLNRSAALASLGRLDEALVDAEHLCALRPDLPDGHYNRAEILLAMFRSQEALSACDAALGLDPEHANANLNRGLALSELRRFAEAQDAFDRAIALDPGLAVKFGESSADTARAGGRALNPRLIYFLRAYERQLICDWSACEQYLQDILELAREGTDSDFPFVPPLAYQALTFTDDPAIHHEISKRVAKQLVRPPNGNVPATMRPDPDRRIRLGYLSPDYREHLNAYLSLPLFRMHSRERFEVYAYSLHPDDGSEARHRIACAADRFVDLSGCGDEAAVQRMRTDGVDILVDLGGYTTHSRPELLGGRSAPIQVNYLGFPGSLGADFVDYRLTDEVVTPRGSEQDWSEHLVFLPDGFFIYDDRTQRPMGGVSRDEYQLPKDAFVFCCFNNTYKIEPGIFDSWMRILGCAPGSVLWLRGWNPRVIGNLQKEARLRGVSPDRLVFAPYDTRERYFARYALADLFLDSFIFNAMTTACDALWMGLPVLTCPGRSTASRVAASLLTTLRMKQLVAGDMAAYEAIACELAADRNRLGSLAGELAAKRNSTPLFDTAGKVRAIERAYLAMWQRFCSGQSAQSFAVSNPGWHRAWF